MSIRIAIFLFVFFPGIVAAQKKSTPKREVDLEGAVNFRDLGGYVTADYRRIKPGRIYRAASLDQLNDLDMEELKRRKIYTVIDFRNEEEITKAPDRLLPGTDYLSLPEGPGSIDDLISLATNITSGREAMIAFYSDISKFKEKYRPFFMKLLALPDTSAVVFHCSNGKDRTGIAAALFLYVLNVPWETIVSDYTGGEPYLQEKNVCATAYMTEHGVDLQAAEQMMKADPQYPEATFNALKRKYGSVDVFLYRELGIGERAKQMLTEKYLQ